MRGCKHSVHNIGIIVLTLNAGVKEKNHALIYTENLDHVLDAVLERHGHYSLRVVTDSECRKAGTVE